MVERRWITTIREVKNEHTEQVYIHNHETDFEGKRRWLLDPGDHYGIMWHIPWCTSQDDFVRYHHYIEITTLGTIGRRYWIWQSNENAIDIPPRYRGDLIRIVETDYTLNRWVRAAPPVSSDVHADVAKVNGKRLVIIRPGGDAIFRRSSLADPVF
jgi:hypothetical protein